MEIPDWVSHRCPNLRSTLQPQIEAELRRICATEWKCYGASRSWFKGRDWDCDCETEFSSNGEGASLLFADVLLSELQSLPTSGGDKVISRWVSERLPQVQRPGECRGWSTRRPRAKETDPTPR